MRSTPWKYCFICIHTTHTHPYTYVCPGLWCKTYFLLGAAVQNKFESHSLGNIKLRIPESQRPFACLDHSAPFKTKGPTPHPPPPRGLCWQGWGAPSSGCQGPLDSSLSDHLSHCTAHMFRRERPQDMGCVLATDPYSPLRTEPGPGQKLRLAPHHPLYTPLPLNDLRDFK